jgi:Integrase core domain/Chromo (CHRromatin Organisation MOdifier) domain
MDRIRSLYYNPKEPSSYGGVNNLFKRVNEIDPRVSKSQVKDWLSGELTYTIHKPVKYRFPRNKTIAFGANEQWQADLADMSSLSRVNNGYKYILTIIDVFSKVGYAQPVKNKKPESIIKAFGDLFREGKKPVALQTDRGTEFKNKRVQAFLKKEGVRFFTSKNQTIKCAVVERFNRTLKGRLYRYFTAQGTQNWVKVLQDVVTAYNNSPHRSIKMTPASVTEELREKVFKNLYGVDSYEDLQQTKKTPALSIGDKVRLSKLAHPFKKGYLPNWTEQAYEIKASSNEPIQSMYGVVDEQDHAHLPRLYPQEVQKIKQTPETTYRIEKILRKRTINRITSYLVKWEGFPPSFNSWVPESDVFNLRDINN